ncbi:cell wall metabolism sensor histidine kinase WalK [Alkalilimnicola ehrlichii]|uniref:sensor histidine kinase n=1 Tax=Alkalilimnicola ehrlichii TaxID=351052 RepID=UPI0015F26E8D|nr:ATP-binding protein [Alkalilimnicola ehrlichii]
MPAVLCDRDRLLQILGNLLSNAVKITGEGGRVSVTAQRQTTAVRFSVSDTGPGIAPDEIPRLFDRYWRGRRASYQGTGLGLAIAKGLVEAHNGHIWVESRLGEGSTFCFSIPAA